MHLEQYYDQNNKNMTGKKRIINSNIVIFGPAEDSCRNMSICVNASSGKWIHLTQAPDPPKTNKFISIKDFILMQKKRWKKFLHPFGRTDCLESYPGLTYKKKFLPTKNFILTQNTNFSNKKNFRNRLKYGLPKKEISTKKTTNF